MKNQTTGFVQIVEQTDEEKFKMYNKLPKKEIIRMLIQANKLLDSLYQQQPMKINYPETQGGNYYDCSDWSHCSNPHMDCLNCPLRYGGGRSNGLSTFTSHDGTGLKTNLK